MGPSKLADFYFLSISFFRSIDLSEALEMPGVVDVITAEDIPGTNGTEDDKLLAVDEVWTTLSQVTMQIITKVPPPASFPLPRRPLSHQGRGASSSSFFLPLTFLLRQTYSSRVRK